MHAIRSPSSESGIGDSAFSAPGASRSWDWLLALRRRLRVEVQIVDEGHRALLPAWSEDRDPGVWARARAEAGAALADALRTGDPQVVAVGESHLAYVPVRVSDRSARGALVIARRAGAPLDTAARARLELLGRWLGDAVEAHLRASAPEPVGPSRALPLWRLLSGLAEEGRDRDLVAVWAEALAVWHDFDLKAHVETIPGGWPQAVTAGGVPAPSAPLELQSDALPLPLELQPMTAGSDAGDAASYVTTLRPVAGRRWLLVVAGPATRRERELLGSYLAILDAAIACSAQSAARRMLEILTRRLVRAGDTAEASVSLVLDDVRTALGSAAVRLTVELPAGTPRCRIELGDLSASPDGADAAVLHAVERDGASSETTILLLRRPAGAAFTPQDHLLAETAVSLLHERVGRALRGVRSDVAAARH